MPETESPLARQGEHIVDRIDAVTKIPPAYRQPVCPAPKSVKISITERCNHSCGYCALRLRRHKAGEMSKADYARIVEECAAAGVQEIGVFFLGEPTMLSWIGEAVSIAKANVPYVFMTSNGTHLRAVERYGDCMRAGLDSLKFSLNYSDPDQYAELTGCAPAGFYQLVENIKATRILRDHLGAKTKLWASAIQYDGHQADRMRGVIAQVEPSLDGPAYLLPLYSMGAFARERELELGYRPTAGNQAPLAQATSEGPEVAAVQNDDDKGGGYKPAYCQALHSVSDQVCSTQRPL